MKSEKQELCDAVDRFADAMKKRLLSKQKQGWRGWNDSCNKIKQAGLSERMLLNASHAKEHNDIKSLVDTANLAMMIWNRLPK